MIRRLALAALGVFALGCQNSAPAGDEEGASAADTSGGDTTANAPTSGTTGDTSEARYTYYRDTKAILDKHCATCHRPGDVAPFSLETGEEAQMFAGLLAPAIEAGTMPPWPPSSECNSYEHDRSLPAADRELLLAWIADGAAIGDPADAPPAGPAAPTIAWDLDMPLPEPYAATAVPDDYRCFVLDWPEDQLKYVIGFDVAPDVRPIVHHAIAFLIPPSGVSTYKNLDAADDGPGYSCFGSPGGGGFSQQWLGAWAPGTQPSLDEKRGIPVQPGSAIVLQMHYHPMASGGPADQTRLKLKLADSVEVPLHVIPFTNPNWLSGDSMKIPAGEPRTVHEFEVDLTGFLGDFFPQAGVKNGEPFVMHEVSLHMHTRGRRASLELDRAGADDVCALYIPDWDFSWQGGYKLREPLTVQPGDRLRLTCEWDNSAANQPIENGVQVDPADLFWGEGTGDEMCLSVLTISPVH
ncbi:monooxygenase [Nannocystis sp. SCPEA4]|uniref:monooxygenase n=1 Tax=Nannocystis sp. SCPEA4 TaxID=2996787 RepID=UPI00226D433E|nr:monooxygenase [Nannocystis sp. SCPEA4]MCY1054277.1 monooxygenase [Nannocystis sp. SCPEA4]